jgi:hypothetical protein
MVSVSENWCLQAALEQLRTSILDQNRPGSVEGLLAQHILHDDQWTKLDWDVECSPAWMMSEYKVTNLDCVVALGYSMWQRFHSDSKGQLAEGLRRVIGRDPFKGGHLSLARSPSRLLGVVLGSLCLGEEGSEAHNWCKEVLQQIEAKFSGERLDPLYTYVRHRIQGSKVPLDYVTKAELYELSFLDWAVRHDICALEPSSSQLAECRERILFQAATSLRFESAHQAAFILSSVNANLFHALSGSRLKSRHVTIVLENFEPAMKRWRWDSGQLKNPIRWSIAQEREVQDILWLILRSYFSDVIDEDTLPKFGHSSYKADFGISSLKLIIEAKFAYSKDDFKKIEKEIQEDAVPYLRDIRYETIIVFIYDASASVQEHDVTKGALLQIPGVSGVVIVSRPSQLQNAPS